MFAKILILLLSASSVFCYVYIIPSQLGKSKHHDNYCFFNDTSTLIKRGESFINQEMCEKVDCNEDYSMSIYGCGTFSLNDPNCLKWKRDLSKPYPQCCTSFICVEYADNFLDNKLESSKENSD
ncbi:CLUMA_CG008023, isoform A [Clunio marinus]|uniref:CLUMA_CG008023, isoform A n=1 Tax=Clunio marinus TaxID=568069 RepID=A0A1J1I6F3_9DIPT|nr:CLUMA_CG008023, isoform A [Clunio marinus]